MPDTERLETGATFNCVSIFFSLNRELSNWLYWLASRHPASSVCFPCWGYRFMLPCPGFYMALTV